MCDVIATGATTVTIATTAITATGIAANGYHLQVASALSRALHRTVILKGA
jgi:hypothetical protein